MRSSTVLVISLKGVAHEIIKNLVLAGIGRLIVMDDESVTEEDLGSGFLFREEEGAVGQNVRTFFCPPSDFFFLPFLLYLSFSAFPSFLPSLLSLTTFGPRGISSNQMKLEEVA